MPELPDVTVYVGCLEHRLRGVRLTGTRVASPFLLRSFDPPLATAHGRRVIAVQRLGKRIVIEFEGELFLVFHLMVAGRFRWRPPGAGIPSRAGLAAFDFDEGTLLMTEAGARKRASLHVVAGRSGLDAHDPGGLEVQEAGAAALARRLRERNHTLKRALTCPRLLSGIGGAYADEILWHARLSPLMWTERLTDVELRRLHASARTTLSTWTERLRAEVGEGFPDRVTAFRDGMAVHGRFGQPCPCCGDPVQRLRYATRETNYCATCQTGGRVYADRVLSRLLKGDWPRTLEEWEQIRGTPTEGG